MFSFSIEIWLSIILRTDSYNSLREFCRFCYALLCTVQVPCNRHSAIKTIKTVSYGPSIWIRIRWSRNCRPRTHTSGRATRGQIPAFRNFWLPRGTCSYAQLTIRRSLSIWILTQRVRRHSRNLSCYPHLLISWVMGRPISLKYSCQHVPGSLSSQNVFSISLKTLERTTQVVRYTRLIELWDTDLIDTARNSFLVLSWILCCRTYFSNWFL